MLSLIDGAATAHTTSSLRAACELPVLSLAQKLATEHGLAVNVEVDERRFIVQFRRSAQGRSAPISEAG